MDLKKEIKDFFEDPFSNQFSYIIKRIDELHDRISDLDQKITSIAERQEEILEALREKP